MGVVPQVSFSLIWQVFLIKGSQPGITRSTPENMVIKIIGSFAKILQLVTANNILRTETRNCKLFGYQDVRARFTSEFLIPIEDILYYEAVCSEACDPYSMTAELVIIIIIITSETGINNI